jgi:hypothetical protein
LTVGVSQTGQRIGGRGGGPGGGNSTLSAIDAWVQANGAPVNSVSSNLYDLAGAA